MAGIGYGDIVPHTDIGKLIAIVYAILGVPIFIAAAWLIFQLLVGNNDEDSKQNW